MRRSDTIHICNALDKFHSLYLFAIKVEYLLSEWVRHFHQPGLMRDGDKVYAAYVARVSILSIISVCPLHC